MGILALSDLQASREYLEELRAEQMVNYEKLKGELDKFRDEMAENGQVDPESNGHDLKQKKDE